MTCAWCFDDQSTPYTEAVLKSAVAGAVIVVPAIWRLEVVNALLVAERRKKITTAKIAVFLEDLRQLPITVDLKGLDLVFTDVLDQARLYQRSAYDASYLELAKRLGPSLATKDEPLRKAAHAFGVALYKE